MGKAVPIQVDYGVVRTMIKVTELVDGQVTVEKNGVVLTLSADEANEITNLLIGYLIDSDVKWVTITPTQLDNMLKDDNEVE